MKCFLQRYCIGIVFMVGLSSPTFCFSASLTDSLDVRIERELERIYYELYFTNFDSASHAFDKQVDRAAQAGRWHMVVSALTLKAKCASYHYYASKTYSILVNAESVAKNYKAALDTLDPGMVYRSEIDYVRGMYFHELGDFSRSIASFETIIRYQQKYHSIDPLNIYYVHSFIGHACFQLMLYDKAYLNYEQGRIWLQSINDYNTSYQQAMVNLLKGQCKESKAKYNGDRNQAAEVLPLYKTALKLLLQGKEKVSFQGALTSAFNRMASLYNFMGKYDSAIYYLNASLKFHSKNDPMRSSTYADFGDIYKKQGLYDKALEFYNKSMAVAEGSYAGKHYRKSIPAFKKAELLVLRKNFQEALYVCQAGLINVVKEYDNRTSLNAIPAVQTESNITLLLEGVALKGKIHFNLYKENKSPEQLKISLDSYNRAIELIQEAQKKYPEAEYKQNIAAKTHLVYEDALEVIFYAYERDSGKQSYDNVIFKLLESNKSILLRDATASTYAKRYAGVPERILERESYLKGAITSMRAKLYQTPGDTSIATWKRDLYDMSVQYDSLLAVIKRDHPGYYQFKYDDQILSLEEVTKQIDERALLVEYFWGERAVYILGINQEKIVVKKISLNEPFLTKVTKLIKSVTEVTVNGEKDSIAQFTEASHFVYKKIMEPILSEWPAGTVNSLIIVPDGLLSYFPFDILVMSLPKHVTEYSTLPYLLKSYSVRNLFSAGLIRPGATEKKYAYAYLGFAPAYANSNPSVSVFQRGSVRAGFLTHNVQEVTEASSYFNGKIFLREKATEKTFRDVARNARVLHLSMHAFTNDQEPSFSGLIFTPADSAIDTSSDEDGLLYLHELYNVSLNAELAVLSACETGSGQFARGEGIMSLGRAFRYAGCENIVMSLWKVNDRSTSQIMNVFFQNLNDGMNKDEALRQAKLSFIGNSQNRYFAHPYYWSAFILTGDPTPLTSSTMYSYLGIVAAAGLVVFLLIAILRRRTRGIR